MRKDDREQWTWSYGLWTGLRYGPVPVGFIGLGIALLAMVVWRLM